VNQELDHIWSRVQAQLALVVDEPTYRIWLEPLRALQLEDGRLLVQVPPYASRWVGERFGRVIQASAELALGSGTAVELVSSLPSAPTRRNQRVAIERAGGDPPPATASAVGGEDPPRNPKLTFDQFVIGDSNRLAHAASLSVAEMPAHAYNPLFICGAPGLGKTHLLAAIANLLVQHDPGMTVRCTTGESFTNEFLSALAGGGTDAFKLRYRDVDVLLVDDVQFLERKTRTEEEFFHTFNALHDGGRQLVLTSDRPPRDLQALEDRLRERFESGLVADIQPPDLATRLAILRKRVQHDRIPLDDEDAIAVIAERVDANVRALEGALIRVVAFSSLTGRPLSANLAREVIDSLYPASHTTPRRSTVEDIQSAACSHFGLSREELLSTARTARVAWPRQLAMFLARELTDDSLPSIGRQFGGRDHSTVLHACRRTAARIAADDSARKAVDKLRGDLHGALADTPRAPRDRRS
jgi:chromosomal replication initiator protein